jgi:outer membrane protein assembly complex protein YaeT
MRSPLKVWRVPAQGAMLIVLLAGAPAAADVADYLGKPVASVRLSIEGRPTSDTRLRALVQVREGSGFSMLAVRETVAHLFSLGEFEDVRVHATTAPAGIDVLFELAPLHPIERIAFTGVIGAGGVDEGRLQSAIRERFGASPPPGRAADIARIVESELARRGYLHARATPRLELAHRPDRATLMLDVVPGPRSVVGAVEVLGEPGVPRPELLQRLGITPGSPYQPEVLASRIDEYLSDRRERGFYEARLAALPRFSDQDRIVTLSLDASQGARVRITFPGDQVPADVRDDLVPIAREGSTDEDLLEDSTNRIRDYLRAQGYRDATVAHQRSVTGSDIVVSFPIERGPRYRLAVVTLEGNQYFPTDALEPLLGVRAGQPFDAARLAADVSTLQELYRRRGFASAQVEPTIEPVGGTSSDADVALAIRMVIAEGPQTLVGSVRVEGNTSVPEAQLLAGLGLKPGAEFFATQVAVDRDAVQSRYANLGFLYATVEADPVLSADNRQVDIVFRVREGLRLVIEHVLIVGNRRTRAETIDRELQIRPGDALSVDGVAETQRRLTALGLFRRTRITQLSHGDETRRDLLVTVEEAPPTTIGYGGGFELGQAIEAAGGIATEELQFAPRSFFEITRRNLFGKNRSVNVFARISLRPQDEATGYGFSEYRLLGTFREPRVLNTAADAFLTAIAERQRRSSFNFARRGFNAEVGRRINAAVSVSGSYQIQRTELFDVKIDDPDEQAFIDRLFPQVLLSSFSGSVIHDTRNDQLNPTAGQYISGNGQFADRYLGSEVGFLKSFLTGQTFRNLPGSRIVAAGSARLGMAVGLLVRDGVRLELPASERFFAGGDTTVRGFALDQLGTPDVIDANGFPVGGNAVVLLNGELRIPIVRSFGLVGFLDSGNVFKRTTDIDLGQLRSAAGFGVRFQSPIGPIRVDLGFKLRREEITPGRREASSAWHISLGQAF